MATNVPAPLKTADVSRFVIRAAQVEKVKPAAAYWCYYFVLDKLLSKGLHKTDDQCQNYVISLMDKVEQMKLEHADEDAIKDEVAAKAYMEQFGTETFLRADNAVRANKASKTTADTFQAAYTFLDVMHVWNPVDQEIIDKIKYAKYHAVRIAKALKAGEDPNDSNPAIEEDEPIAPPLDANDPEVQAITGLGGNSGAPTPGPAGSIGAPPELPQFTDEPPASSAEAPISLPPYPSEKSSKATQAMPHHDPTEDYYQKASQPDVSPLPASEGGGYFPEVPRDSDVPSPALPGPPTNLPGSAASPVLPQAPQAPYPHASPKNATYPGPQSPPFVAPSFQPPPVQNFAPPIVPVQAPQPIINTEVDDAAMVKAQKHARFAISALNFEDVDTAVRELRAALVELGQR